MVTLGEVMQTRIDAVPAASLKSINLAGVYGFGRGLFKRGATDVAGTTYKNFHRLHAGDFVISTPKAWEGAISRIADEFDGWFLSPVFPTFRADDARLDTRYLDWYCKREAVWFQLQGKSKGMGARRETVSAEQFLSIDIPLPPLPEQHVIVARLDALSDKAVQINAHLDAIEADADKLLALRFRDAIANAPYRPMSEVAPVERRNVALHSAKRYREIGARSFGKGLFAKPDFNAAEATWEKPVWIKAGDVVFSNIKAWEGAIALASDEDDGAIASHRYITCVPSSKLLGSFLLYYLLSDEGLEKIGGASAGTADRNRTLSLTKLARIEVPVPLLATQCAFTALQNTIVALKARHAVIRQSNAALVPAVLERIFNQ